MTTNQWFSEGRVGQELMQRALKELFGITEQVYLDGVFITWVYIFVKMQIVYFKWFHFIEYKLCQIKLRILKCYLGGDL